MIIIVIIIIIIIIVIFTIITFPPILFSVGRATQATQLLYLIITSNQDLVSVMKTVRFRQMSTKFLRTRVIPELVEGEEKCRQEVEDALTARRFSREDKDFGTPRNSGNMVYIFSSKTSKFDLFDKVHNACVPCPELTCSDGIKDLNNYRCAVVVQDELYVVSKREVIRFNHVTRKWTWVGDGKACMCY